MKNYIKAGYPGLYVITHEEKRAEMEIAAVAKTLEFKLFAWSFISGLVDMETGAGLEETNDPVAMLQAVCKLPEKSIVLARDFHLFLSEPNPPLLRQLKDTLFACKSSNICFIILGCQLKMQPEIEKEISVIEFTLPGKEELNVVLDGIAVSAGIEINGNRDTILDSACGLTTTEAENAFALSYVEYGTIRPEIVAREKAQTIRKNGILEIVEAKEKPDDIGGLDVLKKWLFLRKTAFSKSAREYGLPVPKGVLTVGIPGCGKSLTAKATAAILNVPLLKMDGGKIFGSLVGESERNLRTAIQTAEAIAPCVLWVDEIEKSFSGSKSSGSTDGGTSARVFGSFLQWMNDKTSPVFVFATANDITQLPPEFLRKGRFDELFYVDLPDITERTEIWGIQIRRYNRNPADFDVVKLAGNSEEFTGSEIEACVSESLFAAFSENREVQTCDLMQAISNTVPLARTMKAEIDKLRDWAKNRARRASTPKENTGKVSRKLINN